MSANLEVAKDDANTLLFFLVKADMERRENWHTISFTNEDFPLRPVISHTIIFH